MGWDSSDVVRFDLRSLLQGQTRRAKLKSAYNYLLSVQEVWDVRPTHRKSCAGSLIMWSDLTLGPSFKGQTWIAKVLIIRLLLQVRRVRNCGPDDT